MWTKGFWLQLYSALTIFGCFYSDIIGEDEEDDAPVRSSGGQQDLLTDSNGEEGLCVEDEEGELKRGFL